MHDWLYDCHKSTFMHSCISAALDQWERELQLFGSLKQLRIFRLYKLWKGFRTWKKAVNETKFSSAKASLSKNLFMLSPVFQSPMRKCVAGHCSGR